MELGVTYEDALGPHPYAAKCWIGSGEWASTTRDKFPDRDGPAVIEPVEMLLSSVPESLQRKLDDRTAPRASMLFLPWSTSGVALVTLVAGDDALVSVMDIAGRRDLDHLLAADPVGGVELTACWIEALDMCPSVRIAGAASAIQEAEVRRRMSAKEFQEAITDVRWLLRGSAAFPFLGTEPRALTSLTLNVVQPLKGRSGATHN